MNTTRRAGLALATLAGLGIIAHPASAQTNGTFTDNFRYNGTTNTNNINAGIGSARQGGTVLTLTPSGVTYTEPTFSATGGTIDFASQLNNPDAGAGVSNLLLYGGSGATFDPYASPNEILSPGVGGTLIATFGTLPFRNGSSSGAFFGPQGSSALGIGTPSLNPNNGKGVGFFLSPTGVATVFLNGVQQGAPVTVTGFSNSTYTSVTETYINNGTSGAYSLVVGTTPIVTGLATPALTDTHFTFDINGDGQSYFNNLSLSSITPSVAGAPEPSQTAMLVLVGVGLTGLLLKARKRSTAGAQE